uniref:Candidate secreted effector n=1 Tax=Meloidogyne incognita TaxID=6306 RepID=A0A914MCE2_MELIC
MLLGVGCGTQNNNNCDNSTQPPPPTNRNTPNENGRAVVLGQGEREEKGELDIKEIELKSSQKESSNSIGLFGNLGSLLGLGGNNNNNNNNNSSPPESSSQAPQTSEPLNQVNKLQVEGENSLPDANNATTPEVSTTTSRQPPAPLGDKLQTGENSVHEDDNATDVESTTAYVREALD